MANGDTISEQPAEEPTLTEDIRMFIGGVVGLALVIVPVILIRKLVKTAEESAAFKAVENKLI